MLIFSGNRARIVLHVLYGFLVKHSESETENAVLLGGFRGSLKRCFYLEYVLLLTEAVLYDKITFFRV